MQIVKPRGLTIQSLLVNLQVRADVFDTFVPSLQTGFGMHATHHIEADRGPASHTHPLPVMIDQLGSECHQCQVGSFQRRSPNHALSNQDVTWQIYLDVINVTPFQRAS